MSLKGRIREPQRMAGDSGSYVKGLHLGQIIETLLNYYNLRFLMGKTRYQSSMGVKARDKYLFSCVFCTLFPKVFSAIAIHIIILMILSSQRYSWGLLIVLFSPIHFGHFTLREGGEEAKEEAKLQLTTLPLAGRASRRYVLEQLKPNT